MQALAIAPVTPPASTPAATTSPPGGNGFSKALDDAASRRADEQAAAAKSPASDAKASTAPAGDMAEAASPDPAIDVETTVDTAGAVDPSLWAQIPLRPETGSAHAAPAAAIDATGAELVLETPAADVAVATDTRPAAMVARTAPAPIDRADRPGPAAGLSSAPADPAATASTPPAADGGLPAPAPPASTGPLPPAGLPGLPTPAAPMASAAAGAGAATSTMPEAQVAVPLDHPGFGAALGTQLSLLARDGVKQARLHLNPAELGPVQVQITVTGQNARVDLVAEQALTRQVLEQSMPSLASSLRESGLTLAGGGVFEQPRQADPQARDPQARAGRGGTNPDAELAAEPVERPVTAGRPRGVVDLYA